jgi:hypothetical protein
MFIRSGVVKMEDVLASQVGFTEKHVMVFVGKTQGWAGIRTDAADDVDGDEYDDFLIGAPLRANHDLIDPGKAYLICGGNRTEYWNSLSVDGFVNLATGRGRASLDDTIGIGPSLRARRYDGKNAFDYAGMGTGGVGEVNGSTQGPSIAVGAPGDRYLFLSSPTFPGEVYIVP